MRTNKKVRIVNAALAIAAQPELFKLNEKTAKTMLASGIKIPGLELYDDESLVIR